MSFVDNVLFLISQKGITKNKLLTDLKLGKNSFINWKERGTIPNGETLSKIANYFNVSTDYLLGNEGKKITPPPEDDEAMDAYIKFSKLDKDSKELIIKMMDKMIND